MTTAYLILAHHQPRHSARLIRALDGEDVFFFIHIDRKSNLDDFLDILPFQDNVIIVKDPVRVHRFDFSQVKAALMALEAASEFGAGFDRYCLLSGSDFPIKSNAEIRSALDSKTQFIRIDARAIPQKFHLGYGSPRFPLGALRGRLRRLLHALPGRTYKKMPLYRGSQWWALTGECAAHVLRFVRDNADYVRYMRFTPVADETFFHSIVKASPFSPDISHDFERRGDPRALLKSPEHGCHYIDWDPSRTVLPKVLDLEDLGKLARSPALFARKFQERESSALLDELERLTGRRPSG